MSVTARRMKLTSYFQKKRRSDRAGILVRKQDADSKPSRTRDTPLPHLRSRDSGLFGGSEQIARALVYQMANFLTKSGRPPSVVNA